MIVVDPVTPLSDALQVPATFVAVKTSFPDLPTLLMLAELVTEPLGPMLPWVLTSSRSELKIVAGPYWAEADGAVAVMGAAEPPGGSVTLGAGPRLLNGPPKRLMLLK